MSSVQLPFHQRLQGLRVIHRGVGAVADAGVASSVTRIDVLLEQQERDARSSEACVQLVDDLRSAIVEIRQTMEQRLGEMSDYVLSLAFGLAERVLDREIDQGRYDLRPTPTELLAQRLHGLGVTPTRIFLAPLDN